VKILRRSSFGAWRLGPLFYTPSKGLADEIYGHIWMWRFWRGWSIEIHHRVKPDRIG
jgi:hypothetical protein